MRFPDGVSHTMGLPSYFLPAPNLYTIPKSIDGGLHPLLGERPGGSEFG